MANYLGLTEETQKFLEKTPKFDESKLNMESIRSAPDFELSDSVPRPPVDVQEVNVNHVSGAVPVLVYRPANSQNEVLPALVYIHGGGWATETKRSYAYVCSKIASEANCAVIYVHYSLSPEARFPVALEECYSVLSWATNPANSDTLKIDPTRVAIAGDSSGGNLAIATTLLAKQRPLKNKIKYQVLIYPVTNNIFNTGSYYEFGTDWPLTRKHMQFFWDQYIPEKADRENILACPLKATKEDLQELPPALIITAEVDVIRDEAEKYGYKLLQAGVPVTTTRFSGVLHSFVTHHELFSKDTLFALDMISGALRRAFS